MTTYLPRGAFRKKDMARIERAAQRQLEAEQTGCPSGDPDCTEDNFSPTHCGACHVGKHGGCLGSSQLVSGNGRCKCQCQRTRAPLAPPLRQEANSIEDLVDRASNFLEWVKRQRGA